jgi:hypothetical protein
MVHTVSQYMARCTIWSHQYVQIKQISQERFGLYISSSAETTTKWIQNKSNQGCMTEVMQKLNKMLQQVNPYAMLYKKCIKLNANHE